MFKTVLMSTEITVHNHREETLVNITRNSAYNCLEWLDKKPASDTIKECTEEQRERIANTVASEVDTLFSAMYYLSMIEEPKYVDVSEIIAWNAED